MGPIPLGWGQMAHANCPHISVGPAASASGETTMRFRAGRSNAVQLRNATEGAAVGLEVGRNGSRSRLSHEQRVSFRTLASLEELRERLDVAELAALDLYVGLISGHGVAEELP